MSTLWTSVLEPGSEKFDRKSAVLCTKDVAKSIGQSLTNCPNDSDLAEYLCFLKDTKSLADAFHEGKSGSYWHINLLYPLFVDLVLHPSEEIRKIIRELFLKVTIE